MWDNLEAWVETVGETVNQEINKGAVRVVCEGRVERIDIDGSVEELE